MSAIGGYFILRHHILTVSNTGLVHIAGAGTASITVKLEESTNYTSASDTLIITVNQAAGSLSIQDAVINKTYGDADFSIKPSDSTPGTILYTADDSGVVSVDNNGMVHINKPGTAVVTISMDATNNHLAVSETITINVAGRIYPYYPIQPSKPDEPAEPEAESVYRLYNPYTGEHFYTSSKKEHDDIVNAGWNDEGIAFTAFKDGDTPVYRLYNPNSGTHLYTISKEEKDFLAENGWNYEGIAFYASDKDEGTPVYRLYNPYSINGLHLLTTSKDEADFITKHGWNYEGVAFNAK